MTYFDRLESRFAEREPGLRAFLPEEGRFDRLRREEAALEARWPDPAERPPLFGVPIGVKDVYHVDGFETRAGSRLPPEVLRGSEGPMLKALRKAGALIMGKTVSTEFAYFAPGPTCNPRNPEHTPGGSSSGSAAAVAAGLCPLALGTQTIGSVIRPAAYCGVVGYKPSHTQVSTDGMVHLAPSVDEVGWFTRDAVGAHQVGQLLCDYWRMGPPSRTPRMAVPEGPYLERASGETLDHFHSVCDRLTDAGYPVFHVPAFADFEEIAVRHYRLVAGEAARVHEPWFARFEELYDPRTAELIRWGREVTDAELEPLRDSRDKLLDDLTGMMDRYRIDLWLSPPALGPAPRGLEATGDPVMNVPWTHAKMPTLCLPAGRTAEGLPMGIQMAAGLGGDEELLSWAMKLERVVQP